MHDPDPLSPAAFARMASELHAQRDPDVTAATAVTRLSQWVDADAVSLTERTREGWRTVASSGQLAEDADRLQYELEEGPCRDAATHTSWLRSGDVARDPRWPAWGPRAGRIGVGSLLSIPILDSGGPASAVNLYSRSTGAFDDRDLVDHCLVYAVHTANALSTARTADQLYTALTSRHVIGMAQGIVMERFRLDQPQSFELLRRISTTTNTKLRDVAARLVETRDLPEGTLDAGDDH